MTASKPAFDKSASNNPLINPPKLPHGAFAFDKVKNEHFEPALDWALDKYKQEIEALKNNPDMPSFKNTIEALEFVDEDLGRVMSVFYTFIGNNSSDELRAMQDTFTAKTSPVLSETAMDDVLFARIKAVHDSQSIRAQLDDEQLRLLDEEYKGRVRSGAELAPKDKARLKDINQELSQLSTKFSDNELEHTDEYEKVLTEEELKGVPERALSAYKATAEDKIKEAQKNLEHKEVALQTIENIDPENFKTKEARKVLIEEAQDEIAKAEKYAKERAVELEGKCLIKLEPYPEEILSHCEDRDLRAEIKKAYGKVCCEAPYDNRPIVLEIVKLRHEKAQILDYKNHADYVISERMAGSVETVQDFLADNLLAYKPHAEKYFNDVKTYAKLVDGIEDFQPHDMGYYERRLKEEKFSFDSEKLRPYFEINRVFDGFRNHIEKLFNVEMIDCTEDYPTYRDDANVYEVHDKKTGKTIALFHTDYYAEAGIKRGGAWMNSLQDRALDKHGVDQIPIITNSCNYQKPTEGQPALLSLREVETIFHEGGHGFHGALAEGRYESQNGTNVKWDFVELPSQLQENWVSQPEVLQSFAIHHETGEVIPQEYIDKIKEMSTYGAGFRGLRQTSLALLDMTWYTTDPATIKSVEQIEDKVDDLTSFWDERTSVISPRFSHIFSGGYSAGYYSYKWAEVLDAHLFTLFEKNGLYDPKTSQSVRDGLYALGNRIPPEEIWFNLMGCKPDPQALFRREGLLSDSNDNQAAPAPKKKKGNDLNP